MPLITELAAVIAQVAKVVKDTREIVEAVHDGSKFLAAKYPDINKDFGDLLDQMQLTIVGLAKVTGVLGGCRIRRARGDRPEAGRPGARPVERVRDWAGEKRSTRSRAICAISKGAAPRSSRWRSSSTPMPAVGAFDDVFGTPSATRPASGPKR